MRVFSESKISKRTEWRALLGAFYDAFNDNVIGSDWTTNIPQGNDSITESGEVLTVYCNGDCDWWSGATETSPIIYRIKPGTDWIFEAKMNSWTPVGAQMSGIMAYKDRDNVWMWGRCKDPYGSPDGQAIQSVISDSGSVHETNSNTTLPMYFRIKRLEGTLYFYYSAGGITWTLLASHSESFTPTHVGMFNKSWWGNSITVPWEYCKLYAVK